MKILIVDDNNERIKKFTRNFISHEVDVAIRYYAALDKLKQSKYDVLFLDHDLGDCQEPDIDVGMYGCHEFTGHDIAAWLVDNPEHMPTKVVVHSLNPEGAKRIETTLRPYTVVERVPFITLFAD